MLRTPARLLLQNTYGPKRRHVNREGHDFRSDLLCKAGLLLLDQREMLWETRES
ncbi:MAG: hypothetical protein KDA84_03950 [Planctomycetaceae bacterium]|nr:hypothetical protein [Planctomycetaceae bacterium]